MKYILWFWESIFDSRAGITFNYVNHMHMFLSFWRFYKNWADDAQKPVQMQNTAYIAWILCYTASRVPLKLVLTCEPGVHEEGEFNPVWTVI